MQLNQIFSKSCLVTLLLFIDLVVDAQLNQLIIFTRHGARTPNRINNIQQLFGYRYAPGDLTLEGLRQMIQKGSEIKKQYQQLFPQSYEKFFQKMEIKYSPQKRTALSSLAFLKGMYPQIFNETNIQTREFGGEESEQKNALAAQFQAEFLNLINPQIRLKYDYLNLDTDVYRQKLFLNFGCRMSQFIYKVTQINPFFQAIERAAFQSPNLKSAIHKIEEKVRFKFNTSSSQGILKVMWHVYDTYKCLAYHKIEIPNLSKDEIRTLAKGSFAYTRHALMRIKWSSRFASSEFFSSMLNNIQDINKNIFIYTGHDLNFNSILANLLGLTGLHQINGQSILPNFASTLIFEIHENEKGEDQIKIIYEGQALKLKICDEAEYCSLRTFKIFLKTLVVKRLDHICGYDGSKFH